VCGFERPVCYRDGLLVAIFFPSLLRHILRICKNFNELTCKRFNLPLCPFDGMNGQLHAPAVLFPWKAPPYSVQTDTRLCGPQSRSGGFGDETNVLSNHDSSVVKSMSLSYRLRYAGSKRIRVLRNCRARRVI